MKRSMSSISYLLNDESSNPLLSFNQEERPSKKICTKEEKAKQRFGPVERTQDFDCPVCLKLLYLPITTYCGHTFCKGCLAQSYEVNRSCPICRACLDEEPFTSSVSVVLKNIIQNCFPEEYNERHTEFIRDIHFSPTVPLFTYVPVLPFETLSVRMIHPHQRAMIRKVMMGEQKLGVVGVGVGGSMMKIACECEIIDLISQPEGYFFVTFVGRNRVKIQENWTVDGYTVGKVELFQDDSETEENKKEEEQEHEQEQEQEQEQKKKKILSLEEIVEETKELVNIWIEKVQKIKNNRLLTILENSGPMPEDNVELFSFWACSLLPLTEIDKDFFLSTSSTKKRLLRLQKLLRTRSPEKSCFV